MINSHKEETAMTAGNLKKFLETIPENTELFVLKEWSDWSSEGAEAMETVLYCMNAKGDMEVIFK